MNRFNAGSLQAQHRDQPSDLWICRLALATGLNDGQISYLLHVATGSNQFRVPASMLGCMLNDQCIRYDAGPCLTPNILAFKQTGLFDRLITALDTKQLSEVIPGVLYHAASACPITNNALIQSHCSRRLNVWDIPDCAVIGADEPPEQTQISLRGTVACQSELKAFAELLRLSQHDLHSFKAIEELEDEVLRAVTSFNSLSGELQYEPISIDYVNSMIINSVQTDWFKKVRTHEHGIFKLDHCIYPLVQIEPRRYFLPNKDSLVTGTVRNVLDGNKLIIGRNSSAIVRFGRKISSLDGKVIELTPEEVEFIGSMHVNWVNRVMGVDETITVLEVSHNTASRNVVMVQEKEELYTRTYLSPISATITDPSRFNYSGLSDIVLTYFILGSELSKIDSSTTIARTVDMVDKAISLQEEGRVAEVNPSVYFRGLEGLTAPNKGFCAYLMAVNDRSRRAELPPEWAPISQEEQVQPSDRYLSSYDESKITICHQWPWATILTFFAGVVAVVSLAYAKTEEILKAIPDYVTLFIFLLLGTVATVHNIWYAQWPLHDAVRGIVSSNNTEKLEGFLGKDAFVGMLMAIKRPDVVFDDHKSCLFAPIRKGKVILHRMIQYGEVRKYGVSIHFNNYYEPVFRKGNLFREVSIDDGVVHVGKVIPAQDLIRREVPAHYEIGLNMAEKKCESEDND